MEPSTGAEYTNIKSIDRVFKIVESILKLDEATLSAISDESGIPESTVYRYLRKMENMGYVHRDGSEFKIGLHFVEIGRKARTRKPAFDHAKPITKKLGQDTKERAQFIVPESGEGVFVHLGIGENAVETDTYIDRYQTYIGKRIPLHATASGKAILAEWDDDRIREFADSKGLHEFTANTITDVEELIDEINDVRENGVSISDQEYMNGLWSASIAINDQNELCGALEVCVPVERLRRDLSKEEIVNMIRGAVNELELRIEYSEQEV